MLGGCSSMNAMIYIRGRRWDFEAWHKLGNSSCGRSVSMYVFKSVEAQDPPAN